MNSKNEFLICTVWHMTIKVPRPDCASSDQRMLCHGRSGKTSTISSL